MDSQDWIITIFAFAVFAVFIGLEKLYWGRKGLEKFQTRDSITNYSLVAMQLFFGVTGKILFIVTALDWIWSKGLKLVPATWWSGVLLFLGVDLGYYWFHRLSHRSRFLWAIHESHHSSELMNLSVALRQPPLEPWVDWLFFIGLAWVGFPAKAILTMYAFNLFYQFFIHTEIIGKLPKWIELVFNTPSPHRVHHGTNPQYIDRNYAGFDYLGSMFGSFELKESRCGMESPIL
ncbi:MAG: sterol desaturase family protein [Acidobacteria bacterium]|nr:sterol desaturase family protein [Acidobacteriota bacterium]